MGSDPDELVPLPSLNLKNKPDGGKGPLGKESISFTYRESNREELVRLLQKMLKTLGYDLGKFGSEKDGIDGNFGNSTEKAVKQFQEENKDCGKNQLKVDGLVGPKTSDALNRAVVGKHYAGQEWYGSYLTPLELTEDFTLLTSTSEALKNPVPIEITDKNKARVVLTTPPPKQEPPKKKIPPPKKPPPKKRINLNAI